MGFFVGGLMIGPLIGTYLLENLDVSYRILFQYSTYAVAMAIITGLLLSKYGKTTQHTTISLGSIKQITKFPIIVIMLIFCSACFGTFLTIYPAFMNDRSISESNILSIFTPDEFDVNVGGSNDTFSGAFATLFLDAQKMTRNTS